jgi:hypothetical protein
MPIVPLLFEEADEFPMEVIGLRAEGTVSVEDYENVVIPLLEEARRQERRIRLLFHFGPEFEGFTAAAAWEDLRVGWRYLRLFERCAVVGDQDWIRIGARSVGAMMPSPVRVFGNADRQEAVEWLCSPLTTSLEFRLLHDRGVVVVEPYGKLNAGDFASL